MKNGQKENHNQNLMPADQKEEGYDCDEEN